MKKIIKIIFLFSENIFNFKFTYKKILLKNFVRIFLNLKRNSEIKKIFILTLKKNFENSQISDIYIFFDFLKEKGNLVKIEILEILYNFFKNFEKSEIFKLEKKKIFPILFLLIEKQIGKNLLDFFLKFFEFKKIYAFSNTKKKK